MLVKSPVFEPAMFQHKGGQARRTCCSLPMSLVTLSPCYLDPVTVLASVFFQSLPVQLFLHFCKHSSNYLLWVLNVLLLYRQLLPQLHDSQPGVMKHEVNVGREVSNH